MKTLDKVYPLPHNGAVAEKPRRKQMNLPASEEWIAMAKRGAAAEELPVATFIRRSVTKVVREMEARGEIPPAETPTD